MPSIKGALFRIKLIKLGLIGKYSQLPVLLEDTSYWVAVERKTVDAVPLGNSAVYSLLWNRLPLLENDAILMQLQTLCRGVGTNQDSCEWDVAQLLIQLVHLRKPQVVIEVGVYRGAASCHLAYALLKNGGMYQLHLADIAAGHLEETRANLERFGLTSNVSYHHGDSSHLADSGALPHAELIFIDGDHTFAGVGKDLNSYWRLLKPDGILILHDSILMNGVRLHIRHLAQVAPSQVYTLATTGGSGVSIISKSGVLAERTELK